MGTSFLRSKRLIVTFICLCGLIMVLAACGGGDSSSSSSSGSSSASGSGGGAQSSMMTVTIKENHASSGDTYMCDPATITVKKGDTVTFTNTTDENQDFDQGDAQKAGIDFVVAINGSKNVTFNTTGTFMIKSEKGATITVNVQ